MFEKLTRQAERVVSDLSVSRRGFLGRTGRGALAAAGAIGVLLATPARARSQTMGGTCSGCHYDCKNACGHDKVCYNECYMECLMTCF
jgi:hypothetical protein